MYIVLEIFGGTDYIIVCGTQDTNCKLFGTEEKAIAYGEENCQMPLVVKLPLDYPVGWVGEVN